MDLVRIYQCFCDPTRLRILHLLTHGPLCVCHFQEVLKVSQVRVSQHLGYLRRHRLVESVKHGTWVIYSLPAVRSRELEMNLKCLQDCVGEREEFRADLHRLLAHRDACAWVPQTLKILQPQPQKPTT